MYIYILNHEINVGKGEYNVKFLDIFNLLTRVMGQLVFSANHVVVGIFANVKFIRLMVILFRLSGCGGRKRKMRKKHAAGN